MISIDRRNATVTDAAGHTFTIGELGKYYYRIANREGCPRIVDGPVRREELYQTCAAVEVFTGRSPIVIPLRENLFRIILPNYWLTSSQDSGIIHPY